MKQYDEIEQRTPEWFFKRGGTITGTRSKGIMGTPAARKGIIYEMIAERLTVDIGNDEDENPMDRGTRLESTAVAEFELETDLKVELTGFCENDDNPRIANSPDGLIGDTMAIEIKCPGGKNHVKYVLENRIPDEYYWQVVQYFLVNEKLEKSYFVSYMPEITVHPLHIIEITRDEVIENMSLAKQNQEAVLLEVDAMVKAFPGVKEAFEAL